MSWVFRATAQKPEGGNVSDVHGLLHTGFLHLKMGLDQFFHFRLAVMKRKGNVVRVRWGMDTQVHGGHWSHFFCFGLALKRCAES